MQVSLLPAALRERAVAGRRVDRGAHRARSILGRPTFELGDLKIAVYPWIENKGDWLIYLGLANDDLPARGLGAAYRL